MKINRRVLSNIMEIPLKKYKLLKKDHIKWAKLSLKYLSFLEKVLDNNKFYLTEENNNELSGRERAVYDSCHFKWEKMTSDIENSLDIKLYFSYKEVADFIDDYGTKNKGFNKLEVKALKELIEYEKDKINSEILNK